MEAFVGKYLSVAWKNIQDARKKPIQIPEALHENILFLGDPLVLPGLLRLRADDALEQPVADDPTAQLLIYYPPEVVDQLWKEGEIPQNITKARDKIQVCFKNIYSQVKNFTFRPVIRKSPHPRMIVSIQKFCPPITGRKLRIHFG
jgi:hypothetical protein